jgi:hypothetical protein
MTIKIKLANKVRVTCPTIESALIILRSLSFRVDHSVREPDMRLLPNNVSLRPTEGEGFMAAIDKEDEELAAERYFPSLEGETSDIHPELTNDHDRETLGIDSIVPPKKNTRSRMSASLDVPVKKKPKKKPKSSSSKKKNKKTPERKKAA